MHCELITSHISVYQNDKASSVIQSFCHRLCHVALHCPHNQFLPFRLNGKEEQTKKRTFYDFHFKVRSIRKMVTAFALKGFSFFFLWGSFVPDPTVNASLTVTADSEIIIK